ncbi:DUF4157 domain-containing protein [Flavobacterium procerum]|uniref:DUF4157 domain-containing protein n=1 Tax=Flavobacterium procerum TaxID=1455569 RepID=A0ABV6BVV9_9FLAO
MNTYADNNKENKKQQTPASIQKKNNEAVVLPISDSGPSSVAAQMQLQKIADNSPQVKKALQLQAIANTHNTVPIQKKANNTGLPDNLKSGIENLSGYSMDDVNVHYNSNKPAELQAHAYAQGTDIHIASGQEKHLPHEAWHVVQQKQGRVKPTTQMKGKVNVNDDAALENEADVMGSKAKSQPLQSYSPNSLLISQPSSLALQLILVDENDIEKIYEIKPNGSTTITQGILKGISGGGWYSFEVGGKLINVRGHDNIIKEISTSTSSPLTAILSQYNVNALSTSVSEFTVNAVAKAYNTSPQNALQMIADSFGRDPRTIRIHYPFGSKTISKGNEAFTSPSETDKLSQAMVSYRLSDYPKHKKVGKDYDNWADELSDSDDSESEKKKMAKRMTEYLTQSSPTDDFSDLSGSERAALGGIFTATQISDRLRTFKDSEVTPMEFSTKMEERSQGKGTMHSIFGSKTSSSFLPARSGGSGQQRDHLSIYQNEIQAVLLLGQNNCLINAICWAAYGRNASMEELVTIRSNLGNVGEMLVATQDTINVIRLALHIPNPITVRYVLGSGAMNETIAGIGLQINIYHTGGNHFQYVAPANTAYDMT